MGLLERLNDYIAYKGYTMKAFEESVGMSNGALGTTIKNGLGVRSDKLENILSAHPDLSAEWLLRGVGSMIKGEGKLSELESRIAQMSGSKEMQEHAYEILLNMFETMKMTFDFFGNKETK